jgi:hypothetical protein
MTLAIYTRAAEGMQDAATAALQEARTEVGLLMQHYGEVRSPFVDCEELSFIEDAPFHSPQQFILAKTPWCTKLCV